MTDRPECGRCGVSDRTVREHVVNREREARIDGRPLEGPRFGIEFRCLACRELVRPSSRETNR